MTRQYEPESALYRITPPVQVVVTLDEMKAHLRVDHDDDDEIIQAFTAAVTEHLDGRDGKLRRALVDQTWELRQSGFPGCGFIQIPLPPLIEVLSMKSIDSNVDTQTVDVGDYHVTGVGDRGRIDLRDGKSWPTLGVGWPEPVIIRFRAGYLDNGDSPPSMDVPAPIVAAIKLLTANLYENRQTVVLGQTAIELPWAAEALLQRYCVFD